jgi:1-acyl-sn-glycerol-3-phosphate acyltransferase
MIYLRSILLWVAGLIVTPPVAILILLASPLGVHRRYRVVTLWADIMMWVVRTVCRIDYEVIGKENLPQRPSVVLSKHQSTWETIAFQHIFPPLGFVLKKELLRIPFFGWGLAQMPVISIDRAAGRNALEQVVEQGRMRLEQGFWMVIFPEGTRIAPGETRRYKPGGAYLATQTGAPVVPVAHNAGEFWRRRAFRKYPGTITVSIGPAIDPAGLTTDEVNAKVEAWIEGEMHRLFPHHYAPAAEPARTAARAKLLKAKLKARAKSRAKSGVRTKPKA